MSYDKVNYAIRPAKSIQRKMLSEAFSRLQPLGALESSYCYIGFGSIFFTDFSLMHRALGLRRMISIEKRIEDEERVRFNRPFDCIEVMMGESGSVLSELPWKMKAIVWLDYDKRLNDEMLADIQHVCANALGGTMLVVTVDADLKKLTNSREAIDELEDDKVPGDVDVDKLVDWDLADLARQVIFNEIEEALSIRGRAAPAPSKFRYRQLFNFRYSDGTRMLTTGGILYRQAQQAHVDACRFDDLDFFRSGSDPFVIDVPILTLKEIRYLDSLLPLANRRVISSSVPVELADMYKSIYRYFPTFVEAEL